MSAAFLPGILAIVLGAFCLPGCGVLAEYEVSVPEAVPAGGDISGAILQLRSRNLKLAVEVQNYRGTGVSLTFSPWLSLSVPVWDQPGGVGRSLLIWLAFTPKDSTDSFIVDVSRVLLKTGNGEQIAPIDFIGPSPEIWQSPRTVARGCGRRRFGLGIATSRIDPAPEDIRAPGTPVSFQGPHCVVVRFPSVTPPEQPFTLALEGVRQAGQVTELPEVRYRRGLIVKVLSVP